MAQAFARAYLESGITSHLGELGNKILFELLTAKSNYDAFRNWEEQARQATQQAIDAARRDMNAKAQTAGREFFRRQNELFCEQLDAAEASVKRLIEAAFEVWLSSYVEKLRPRIEEKVDEVLTEVVRDKIALTLKGVVQQEPPSSTQG